MKALAIYSSRLTQKLERIPETLFTKFSEGAYVGIIESNPREIPGRILEQLSEEPSFKELQKD